MGQTQQAGVLVLSHAGQRWGTEWEQHRTENKGPWETATIFQQVVYPSGPGMWAVICPGWEFAQGLSGSSLVSYTKKSSKGKPAEILGSVRNVTTFWKGESRQQRLDSLFWFRASITFLEAISSEIRLSVFLLRRVNLWFGSLVEQSLGLFPPSPAMCICYPFPWESNTWTEK